MTHSDDSREFSDVAVVKKDEKVPIENIVLYLKSASPKPDVKTISEPDVGTIIEPDVGTISVPDVEIIIEPDVKTNSVLQKLVHEKGQDAQFEDPEFPAVKESLILDWNDHSHKTTSIKDNWKHIKIWLRPDKISSMKMPIHLWKEGV